ncbi:hypothetical protein D3C80_1764770 [compost metagenome]
MAIQKRKVHGAAMGRGRTIASVLKSAVGGAHFTRLSMSEARRLVVVDHADRLHEVYGVMAYESDDVGNPADFSFETSE